VVVTRAPGDSKARLEKRAIRGSQSSGEGTASEGSGIGKMTLTVATGVAHSWIGHPRRADLPIRRGGRNGKNSTFPMSKKE